MIRITMENGKTIDLELDREAAPITVDNFEKLVKDEFYDGLIFHRVIKGFMIQGGDPTGTGMGGPGWEIKGEFRSNGWNNPISHKRGVISMARSMMPDSAVLLRESILPQRTPNLHYATPSRSAAINV